MSENNRRLNSRLNRPNRKKKTNTLLNVLIGIVLLLIIVVVVNIVTDKETTTSEVEKIATNKDDITSDEDNSDKSSDADVSSVPAEQSTDEEEGENEQSETQINSEEETSQNDDNESVVTESSDDPNVEEVTVNPSWNPIGTSQTGEHISSYDSKSIDWDEKVQALSYGSGLDPSNMFVKFLGNGGSPQKSIGTVVSRDGTEIYRISLEWIDGEGWKPTKKEKLTSLEDAS